MLPEDGPHGRDLVCSNPLPLCIETLKHAPLYEDACENLKEAANHIAINTIKIARC